jgi:hypothetical protein
MDGVTFRLTSTEVEDDLCSVSFLLFLYIHITLGTRQISL